jgi:hypothetical protein
MNKFVSDIDEKMSNIQTKIKEFKRISDKINADLEAKTALGFNFLLRYPISIIMDYSLLINCWMLLDLMSYWR